MLSFGEELKRLADEKGYSTQKQLAEASGVSQQTVAALFLNKSPNVSAIILGKLSKALGVSADILITHLSPIDEPSAKEPAPVKPAKGKKGKK